MSDSPNDREQLDALKTENEELKSRIEELEAIRERYSLAMEGSNEGLWEWNPVTKELLVSPRLMETLGHDPKNPITDTYQWLEWVHPDDRALYEQKVSEHLKGQSDYFEWEYRVCGTDGAYHWVFARGKAQHDPDGIARRMVGSVGIITDRKIAQQKLKRAHDELERRVEERTKALVQLNVQLSNEIAERRAIAKELNIAKELAEQANLSKDKYLAAASHDLLQPLNAARLLVSTLQERDLPAKDQAMVERIHTALGNAEDLLGDLLDIAKLDANAVMCDIGVVRSDQVIHSLIKEFETVAKNANIDLRVIPSHRYIETDPRLLSRILRNFLSNAIRYSTGGRVLVGCRLAGKKLRFEVWDTGPGIPDDKYQEIFQEFKQLNNIPSPKLGKGVGLGLAIVERIAKILNTPIQVRSQVNKGSVFSVDVALSTVKADALDSLIAPRTHGTAFDLCDTSILIIDNEGSITLSMADLLAEWGAKPRCALSKAAALSEIKYASSLPDIILADYHLDDGETGLEVLQAIRKTTGKTIPGIVITADHSPEVAKKCSSDGYFLLNKPLKPAKLRSLLQHILSEAAYVNA